ncbi:MAG: Hsp20/alpha crystallin family protein [candidate division NC10 bacterium]|nr:Hsp20/alpha crystallin family protein [candidate division NC10 bacterium]
MALERWKPRGAVSRWDPFADLFDFRREMDRLMDTFFGRTSTGLAQAAWAPAVDIYETKDALVVKAELPGVKPEEVEISIVGNTLTLKGERKQEAEVNEQGYYRLERSYGSFQRALELPSVVDANTVKATYKDGLLEIKLPKKEGAKPKEIKIEVA